MMTSSTYASRRAHLAEQLGEDAVALIPTALPATRSRDTEFLFRPDSYFYYLTGFQEPHAWLVLAGDGRSTLFCQPKCLEQEIWDGYRLGVDAAKETLGVHESFSIEELGVKLPQLLGRATTLWYPFDLPRAHQATIQKTLRTISNGRGAVGPARLNNVCVLLDEMRLMKDNEELDIMRRAASISAKAHCRAMQRSARAMASQEDLREYHLDAELSYAFRDAGAESLAYNSIVAAGVNACVLHYRADVAPIQSGELVLIDAGCELHGYASDITRTFPANGRFTAPQKALYEVVLAAQNAAAAVTRSGTAWTAPHEAALKVIAQGLLDLGIVSRQQCSTAEDVIAQKAYSPFFMHRTSHWLGMDVHDCGTYKGRNGEPRLLEPNMVLTLEPGLYIRPTEGVPEEFHHLGIRIEDDAVVTQSGCDLISREVPVTVAEIEELMRAGL